MKHYRIVRIASLHYDTPMLNLYTSNPELHLKSYAEQQRVLFQTGSLYSDTFSKAMKSLGHHAYEIVYDLEILQKTWACENGIKYDSDHWQRDLILAQIEDLKPDIVYFQHNSALAYSIRKNLKAYFPFIKLVVVYMGFPTGFNEMDDVDILIVGCPVMLRQYNKAGLSPYLVYHWFDEGVLEKLGTESYEGYDKKYDFTFSGMSGAHSAGSNTDLVYRSRYWMLVELIRKTNIELWVDDQPTERCGLQSHLQQTLKNIEAYDCETLEKILAMDLLPKESIGNQVRDLISQAIQQKHEVCDLNYSDSMNSNPKKPLPLRQMFPHRCHPPVFGLDMYRILRQSKVTLNKHTDFVKGSVCNMRMFEAAGIGTCLLSDTAKNMSDLFEADSEIVTYNSVEECIEKVNYLLEHDDVREQIAAAGHKRTMKDHTAVNRSKQIDEIIQKML